MKAVIYARYSSDNQREESIEGQIRECLEYAKYNDIEVVGQYVDRAFSAKTDNRPEFQKMIKDSARGSFDIVLVWKLDRFARNRYDSARYKMMLKKNGVKVVSAKENIADDATGILLESMLEGYAEFYSAELSEKVKRGMKENALKGDWNGGSIPYGYRLNNQKKLIINEEERVFVQEIFQMCSDGKSSKEIFRILTKRGITRSNGKPIHYNSILYMLSNRIYIGEYRNMGIIKKTL